MNTLTNIFFVFIFMFLILFYKIFDINDKNYLLHKVIIFVALFCYQYVVLLMSKFKNGCKIDYNEILKQSVETATVGIIGYSIYNDLQYADIPGVSEVADDKIKYIYIAVIITLTLTFVNSIKLLFGYTPYECIKIKNKKIVKKIVKK